MHFPCRYLRVRPAVHVNVALHSGHFPIAVLLPRDLQAICGENRGQVRVIDIGEPVGVLADLDRLPFLEGRLHPLACQAVGPVPPVALCGRIRLLVFPLDQADHDQRDHAYEQMRVDVLRLADIHRPGVQRPLHFLELALDPREAVVFVDHLQGIHVELARHDDVISHEAGVLLELPSIDHRCEPSRIKHFPGLLVQHVPGQEPPQAGRLRARHPEACRALLQPRHKVKEALVLPHVPLVEVPAPVGDGLLPDVPQVAVLVPHLGVDGLRLVAEPAAGRFGISFPVQDPALQVPVRLADRLADDVSVPAVQEPAHDRPGADAPVRDEDEPGTEPELPDGMPVRGHGGLRVQRVAGKQVDRDRQPRVVEEHRHLDDGQRPLLLAHPLFPDSLRQDIPASIRDVVIRSAGLEIEVGDVIEQERRVAPGMPGYGAVHALQDPVPVLVHHVERVIDMVRVAVVRDYRLAVVLIVPDRADLGAGAQDPVEDEQAHVVRQRIPDP